MAQPMMRWVNVSLSSRLFIVFSVSSVSLCPLCLNKPVDYVLACHRRALLDVVFDTEDTETQRTQRNFVISHQRLYRPRTVEFAVLRLRRVHQDRRAAFLSTPSQSLGVSVGSTGAAGRPSLRAASASSLCSAWRAAGVGLAWRLLSSAGSTKSFTMWRMASTFFDSR